MLYFLLSFARNFLYLEILFSISIVGQARLLAGLHNHKSFPADYISQIFFQLYVDTLLTLIKELEIN